MLEFKDHFSKQADIYAKYRPRYPESLFSFLASIAPGHDLALDCATGNGQAALGLTPYFENIRATDASRAQLELAVPHSKITYQTALAEALPAANGSADLLTVASGAHWFDLEKFYAEAYRVLKDKGVIALWVYSEWFSTTGLATLIREFEQNIVGDYWPNTFQKNMNSFYENLPFPFDPIPLPQTFEKTLEVDQEWVLGFLKTWSATQRYIEANNSDPTALILERLRTFFASPNAKIDLSFKLALRVGKKRGP